MNYINIDTNIDTNVLLNNSFDNDSRIDKLMEEEVEVGLNKERDELITIFGIIADDVEKTQFINNQGKIIKSANFSVISNNGLGEKVFHNCTVHNEQVISTENFKKGQCVVVFGKLRAKMKINNMLYSNIKVLSTKITGSKS